MKNYLFAPFKNDDDKITEFNAVVNALKYVVDAEETHYHESALHGLRVFVGRLESYYDVIISKLNGKLQAVSEDKASKWLSKTSKRLINQVSSNRGSNSTHTIAKELDEYLENNATCKGVKLFIIPIEEFDEDECCHKWFTWDEGIDG